MRERKRSGSQFLHFVKNIKNQRGTIKWLAGHTKPFFGSLMILLVLNSLSSLVNIAMALISRTVIDTATAGGSITNDVVLYVVVILVSMIVGIVSGILATIINERFAFGIRLRIYKSVMHTCWTEISKFHSGDIITRLSSDVDIVATGIAEIIPSIFTLGVSLIASFVTLAWFDLGIALFALILGPVTALIGIVAGRKMRPVQEKIQQSESAYKSYMQESVENLAVFKAFGMEDAASTRLAELREARLKWILKRQKISASSSALLTFSFQTGYIAAFVYSALRLSRNMITYGTMSIFINLVGQIQAPVVGLSRMIPRVVSIFTSAKRIIDMDDMPDEDMTVPAFADGPLGLEADELGFAYGSEQILQNVNTEIKPGEFVALMGSSGIGKTTFVRMVMGLLTPQQGSMTLYDGAGAQSAVTAGAREYLSYVPQGNTLISGTIMDNLRMGGPDLSEEAMWALLKVVAVDEFVRSTPNGLNTLVGERGLGLSEGQAQRIAIARALAKEAPFLILDEATSALDEATEVAVLQHLRHHTRGITCLLITHRWSVLKFCDRCIRIEDKAIIEEDISGIVGRE